MAAHEFAKDAPGNNIGNNIGITIIIIIIVIINSSKSSWGGGRVRIPGCEIQDGDD